MAYHNTFSGCWEKYDSPNQEYKDPVSIAIFVDMGVKSDNKGSDSPLPGLYL